MIIGLTLLFGFELINLKRYSFGESEMIKKKEFKTRIASLLDEAKAEGPVFLVFHDPSQDVK